MAAVGEVGAGGGGGGGGAVFFLHAPSMRIAARAMTVASTFKVRCFMFFLFKFAPPADQKLDFELRRSVSTSSSSLVACYGQSKSADAAWCHRRASSRFPPYPTGWTERQCAGRRATRKES